MMCVFVVRNMNNYSVRRQCISAPLWGGYFCRCV